MPKEYVRKKESLKLLFGDVPTGLVSLYVTAVRAMPKSWSKAKKEASRGKYTATKPDADNIIGAVMDSLLDKDERAVRIFCEKIWGDDHELRIAIVPIEE